MAKVLIIAEHHQGKLLPSTKTTISAGLQLDTAVDILYASHGMHLSTELAALQGVQTVLCVTHPRFEHIVAEDIAPLIVEISKNYTHILAPATTFGKNLMPRVAALLDMALISDVIVIENQDIFIRPIYAGNALEKVRALDAIKILTIRTTAFEPVPQSQTVAAIKPLDIALSPFEKTQFKNQQTPELVRPELTSAKRVVSGGRGLKNAENFTLLEKLADTLGAAMGASRAAVDAGWVPNDLQVGQTGKVVAPELYIAIGISGAIQHLAGMKDSKIIVAINTDPEAPIFQVADYGLVADGIAVLPELIDALAPR